MSKNKFYDILKNRNARIFLKEGAVKLLKFCLLIYIILFLAILAINTVQKFAARAETEKFQAVLREAEKKAIPINEPDSIIIPKIGASAPIVFVNSTKPADFKAPLKRGVAHFPSALPGEKGRVVILGHSAPPYWPKIHYDGVFSDLNDLAAGDEINIIFKGRQYKYRVTEKIFLKKGQDVPHNSSADENSHSELLLISCWPPGIDNKRIVVVSELAN